MLDISTVITVISLALAAATFFIGRITANHDKGKKSGELEKDIEHIKASVDRIEKSFDRDVSKLEGQTEQVSLEARAAKSTADEALQSAKSAHRRIDDLKGGK